MEFIVNGEPIKIVPKAGEMLSDLLRERLGLIGTKIGCNEAECGSCTVLINGDPVLACVYPADRVEGKEVLTIEGLASIQGLDSERDGESDINSLSILQQAFIKYGAVQCGFCTPGQIMTAYALLERNPQPADEDIRIALKDTLCRCGAYPSIIKAIKASAHCLRTGNPLEDIDLNTTREPLEVIGTIQVRPDSLGKATGRALFTDDLKFDGMLHARVKRAGVPHSIIRSINVEKARRFPGVEAVLTADNIPGERNHGLVIYDWPVLVGIGERVRYSGDAIALVAAESRDIAGQALDLIEVELEELPVIDNPRQSHQPDAIRLHENGNLLKHIKVRKGDVERGFTQSDVTLERTYNTTITEQAYIEPECSIARMTTDGRMEIYVGSQIPYADRNQVARVLGWPEERVRVIGMMIGGGFGGKEDIAGQIHAALLAQATGHAVKILFDRRESFLVHPKRHATEIRVKVGARNNGELLAIRTELYGDTGAYASLGEKVMARATTHSSGPYDAPHAKADCFAMYTNNPPAGAFRGFGVTQSCFAIESTIDELAGTLGLDPIELRRMNGLRVGSITNTGQELRESVGLRECIDRVESEMRNCMQKDESPSNLPVNGSLFTSRAVDGAPHLRRAWGFALAYKNTGLGGGAPDKASAEVELFPDGMVEVRTSSAEIGQGLVTVLQMIVAQEFGLPLSRVRVHLSDTDLTPDGGPTTASRQTYVSGNAARLATKALQQALISTIAERYDQPPDHIRFVEGLAQVDGHTIPLGEVVGEMRAEGREARALYEYWAPTTKPLGEGGDMHFAFSFAAQAAEVQVDTRTGEVSVLRVIAANDVGRAINPLGLRGQIEGGVMMGLGNALTENFIVERGRVITDRLARYRIPTIADTPEIISIVVEHPTTDGPYGAKGVGEISSIPTTPAITNAIYNAVGVRITRLPVDQEEIVRRLGNSSYLD